MPFLYCGGARWVCFLAYKRAYVEYDVFDMTCCIRLVFDTICLRYDFFFDMSCLWHEWSVFDLTCLQYDLSWISLVFDLTCLRYDLLDLACFRYDLWIWRVRYHLYSTPLVFHVTRLAYDVSTGTPPHRYLLLSSQLPVTLSWYNWLQSPCVSVPSPCFFLLMGTVAVHRVCSNVLR